MKKIILIIVLLTSFVGAKCENIKVNIPAHITRTGMCGDLKRVEVDREALSIYWLDRRMSVKTDSKWVYLPFKVNGKQVLMWAEYRLNGHIVSWEEYRKANVCVNGVRSKSIYLIVR